MKCTVCNKEFKSEEPKILAMGAYGTPKYVCDGCSEDLDEATLGREPEKIAAAMDRIGQRLADTNPDKSTFMTVNSVMKAAAERANLIKEGKYDFSLDEEPDEEEEGFDEIPEELLETEEDKELDRQDEEKLKKFDKVYNVIIAVALAATAGIIIWRILDTFLF
jgi:hypothetical protein